MIPALDFLLKVEPAGNGHLLIQSGESKVARCDTAIPCVLYLHYDPTGF